MHQAPRFLNAGDSAVSVEFGAHISPEINQRIRAFDAALLSRNIPGIIETVPTYCALTVHFDPSVTPRDTLLSEMTDTLQHISSLQLDSAMVIEIPVLYGGDMGPDLPFVAKHCKKTEAEVIALHAEPEYLIYMLGFTPGFAYLGGLHESLATPRLQSPRLLIPGGSVGIAGEQTGIYPMDSPGGWQLIGRTPLRLYDPLREPPILLEAGWYVKFKPIDAAEYARIEDQVKKGLYRPRTYPKE